MKDILQLSAKLRGKDCSVESLQLCERLELDINRKVDELSFGNRKKVSIVTALQHKPQILILDEPTSGLDPLMQREFFRILVERNQEGTTIFLSSHILSEIQRYCTRAAIIRDGRIIACDKVENLTRTNVKRVTIQGHINLESMEGVKDYLETEENISFLFGGDIQQLLSALSMGNITDLSITEPDLEEVFLHYYERRE